MEVTEEEVTEEEVTEEEVTEEGEGGDLSKFDSKGQIPPLFPVFLVLARRPPTSEQIVSFQESRNQDVVSRS